MKRQQFVASIPAIAVADTYLNMQHRKTPRTKVSAPKKKVHTQKISKTDILKSSAFQACLSKK
jgi:hypothetical protein